MPTYSYNARNASGEVKSGTLEVADQQEAMRKLRAEGLTVTSVRLGARAVDAEQIRTNQAARNVKREEVISFSAQMGIMLETGVPLSEALGAFVSQSKSGNLKRIIEIVADRITSGVSFSASISEFPKVFPTLMISLLRASEATGALGTMLSRVAEYLGKDRQTKKQIKGALMYPTAMVVMAIVVTGFLVAWVLPRFARIYESRSAALPRPTQILLSLSDALSTNLIQIVFGVGAVVGGFLFFRSTRKGRYTIDWIKVHSPIIGPIFTNYYLTRSMRTLSTLLGAGVNLPEAINIVRGVTTNVLWTDLWNKMEESMNTGGTISEVLLESSLAPASFAQMVAAGERTGKLPEVLERVADVAERDLDEAVKSGTQMIEPIMITLMGAMIGGVAIALLLPIFTMGNTMH